MPIETKLPRMNLSVSVFGLGYVGCVSAACLAKEGHTVIGVDVSGSKVALINAGKSTIIEEGIRELVSDMHATGRLSATTDVAAAVAASEISIICVGTPSRANGNIDLAFVTRVAEQIGEAIARKSTRHTVVVRSTVLPGTTEEVVKPALERTSGMKAGEGFALCTNPEFLREGTAIRDFYEPPFSIIGATDPESAAPLHTLYAGINTPTHVVPIKVAEMLKYACNAYHGLKVSFANEIGNICKAMSIDSHEVMRLFCEDTKLNVSPAYLKPGFAFGGSCLPKDLRAISYRARQFDIETPLLTATLESNKNQVQRAFDMVMSSGARKVGVLGLTFKAGTDDLRESPMVSLIELLYGKGVTIAIHDDYVSSARLIGANKEFIEKGIPHIWKLMRPTVRDVLSDADVVVIGNGTPEYRGVQPMLTEDQVVIDLVRAFGARQSDTRYQGICW
jgi:GDP-mannose 6-dehydrogenase